MIQEITEWLASARDYGQGAALYAKYGDNARLKAAFAQKPDATLRGMLVEHLKRIAQRPVPGHTMAGLQPPVAASLSPSGRDCFAPPGQPPVPGHTMAGSHPAPEAVKKVVSLRDRFPFLRQPECPDELKVLVADMVNAYEEWQIAHDRLLALPADHKLAEAAQLAQQAVERAIDDQQMWRELEYYRDNGTILGEAEQLQKYRRKKELQQIPDLELLKQQNSARANLSKSRRAGKDELAAKWQEKLGLIDEEILRRRKNV